MANHSWSYSIVTITRKKIALPYPLLLQLLLLFVGLSAACQLPTYHINHYNSDNGLNVNGLKEMAYDDSTHFLWIGTDGGLLRYDGNKLQLYNKTSSPSIHSERTSEVHKNSHNQIYVTNEWGSVIKIKNQHFYEFTHNEPLTIFTAQQLFQRQFLDVSEQFYHQADKLSIYNRARKFRLASYSDTACFILDEDSCYYLSISSRKIHLPDSIQATMVSLFKVNNTIIYQSTKGFFYAVALKHHQLTVKRLNLDKSLLGNAPPSVFWREGRPTAICTKEGKICKLVLNNHCLSAIPICNFIPDKELISDILYIEPMRTIFITIKVNGFYELKEQQIIKPLSKAQQIDKYTIAQIAYQDSLVIASGLGIYGTTKTAIHPFKKDFGELAFSDSHNNIWWKGAKGLHTVDLTTHKDVIKYIDEHGSHISMTEWRDTVFALAREGLLYFTPKCQGFIYKTDASKMKNQLPYDMMFMSSGQLLVASYDGVIRQNIYQPKNIDTILKPNDAPLRTISRYQHYFLFGSYGNGIHLYDGKKARAIPLDKELNLLFTHAFVIDSLGYCWISTNKGIYQAKMSDLVSAFEDTTIKTIYYHHYSKEDGMINSELNGGCIPSVVTLKNGIISFPSVKGVVWVNPYHTKPNLPNDKIWIEQVLVNKSVFNWDEQKKPLQLPSNTYQLSFLLAFTNWGRPENSYISYQLDKGEWINLNLADEQTIQLNQLSYGAHTLIITKLNGFGLNNKSEKKVRFYIEYPWHFKWWIVLLEIGLVVGIIWLIVRLRTGYLLAKQKELEQIVQEKTQTLQEQNELLEKKNEIKTRLISVISHDVVTPLKYMYMTGNTLAKNLEKLPQASIHEAIVQMAATSKELEILSTNILNWIKYEYQDRKQDRETFMLYDVAQLVLGLLRPLAKEKNIVIHNEIPPDFSIAHYNEPVRILIHNILMNAIQFTPQDGIITIRNHSTATHVVFSITDTGIGMTEQQKVNILQREYIVSTENVDEKRGSGLGYLIIRELLKLLEANITIESELKKGTCVTIAWAYPDA